jgi:hypothetical protein
MKPQFNRENDGPAEEEELFRFTAIDGLKRTLMVSDVVELGVGNSRPPLVAVALVMLLLLLLFALLV